MMEKVKQNYSLQFIKMKKPNRYEEPSNLQVSMDLEDSIITYKYFKDIKITYPLRGISFDNCVFENCTFVADIKNCTFFNTKFSKCEMSNIMFMSVGFHSCLIEKCHMVGINYVDTKIKNTDILGNHMKLSILSHTYLDKCIFKDINMSSSSFDGVYFDENTFEEVDMREAEIYNTDMAGVDITGCNIDGIKIQPDNVRGMIVNEVQAIELINILGVVIK